ncbi:MAG: hypothetical protein ACO268_04855 [Opitutales bacterium]
MKETVHDEEELGAYRKVQALALAVPAGTLWAAGRMAAGGVDVWLGRVEDASGKMLMLGVKVAVPAAVCGAIAAYLCGQDRAPGPVRAAAWILLAGNLMIPLAWAVLWLIKG